MKLCKTVRIALYFVLRHKCLYLKRKKENRKRERERERERDGGEREGGRGWEAAEKGG